MEISERCKLSYIPLLHKFIGSRVDQLLFMFAFLYIKLSLRETLILYYLRCLKVA